MHASLTKLVIAAGLLAMLGVPAVAQPQIQLKKGVLQGLNAEHHRQGRRHQARTRRGNNKKRTAEKLARFSVVSGLIATFFFAYYLHFVMEIHAFVAMTIS